MISKPQIGKLKVMILPFCYVFFAFFASGFCFFCVSFCWSCLAFVLRVSCVSVASFFGVFFWRLAEGREGRSKHKHSAFFAFFSSAFCLRLLCMFFLRSVCVLGEGGEEGTPHDAAPRSETQNQDAKKCAKIC